MARMGTTQFDADNKTKSELRVRLYQPSDRTEVRELFMLAMAYGPDGPGTNALKAQPFRPASYIAYVLFLMGLILSTLQSTRKTGLCLSLIAPALFFAWRWWLFHCFLLFCTGSLKDDLADISKHYKMPPMSSKDNDKLTTTGPDAFWVVESIVPGNERGEVVGIVGLDTSTDSDKTTGELRRMVVSPRHRGRGIAGLLLRVLIDHAKKEGLSSVFLTTSEYQPGAVYLYKKFGWREESREHASVLIDSVLLFTLRLHLEKQ